MRNNLRAALLAAGTLLILAAPASAQGYGYENAAYENGVDENVTVSVPRYAPQRSELGAPYRYISMSKGVYFGDLNLRTRSGARELKDRIGYTARMMCRQLDVRYPVTAPGSPGCYTTAMNDAMEQANFAIAEARGYKLGRY